MLPFRVAVTWAEPGATAVTGTVAVKLPAATLTLPGTLAMPTALLARVTVVAVVGARLRVTVSVPGVPWVSDRVAGVRLTTVSGGATTLTVALRLLPFKETATEVLPCATPVTGMATVV